MTQPPRSPVDDSTGGLPLSVWTERRLPPALSAVRARVEVRRTVSLTGIPGSMVRGQLGARLRSLRCLTGAPTCEGCAHGDSCDYTALFEHPSQSGQAHGDRDGSPYWLAGLPVERVMNPGATFSCELRALGPALPRFPYLEIAFRDALSWVGGSAWGLTWEPPRALVFPAPILARRWRLVARSPLVLGGDPERCREDCPEVPLLAALVRSGVRRIAALRNICAPDAPRERVLYPDLTSVRLLSGKFSWWEEARYSVRQNRKIPLGGWTGQIEIEGRVLEELSLFFQVLSVVGVGKATVLGLGELHAEAIP